MEDVVDVSLRKKPKATSSSTKPLDDLVRPEVARPQL
jgi:hypothetical protein